MKIGDHIKVTQTKGMAQRGWKDYTGIVVELNSLGSKTVVAVRPDGSDGKGSFVEQIKQCKILRIT